VDSEIYKKLKLAQFFINSNNRKTLVETELEDVRAGLRIQVETCDEL
jgi:hypothetical protein